MAGPAGRGRPGPAGAGREREGGKMAKGEWWRSGRPAGSNPTPRDLEGRPFASGRFRICHKGRYLKGNMKDKPLVAKVSSGTRGLQPPY